MNEYFRSLIYDKPSTLASIMSLYLLVYICASHAKNLLLYGSIADNGFPERVIGLFFTQFRSQYNHTLSYICRQVREDRYVTMACYEIYQQVTELLLWRTNAHCWRLNYRRDSWSCALIRISSITIHLKSHVIQCILLYMSTLLFQNSCVHVQWNLCLRPPEK